MDDSKPWYASKTIWASILQVLVGLAVSFGFFSETAGDAIISEGPDLIVGIVVGIFGLVGLWGRSAATKTVTLT